MLPQKKITFDSFIRGVLSGAVIIAILYLLNRLSGVLLPFFIAWLIAYLTYPMVIFYQNRLRLRSRVLSILAVMLTLVVLGGIAFSFFVPPMIEECAKLKELIEIYLIEDRNHAAIPETVSEFIRKNIDFNWLQNNITTDNIVSAIQKLLPKVWTLLSTSYNIILAIFTLFIIILYLFFILLDYEQIANGWITLLPKKYQGMALRLTTDIKTSMNRYFRGQALVAFCVGILFSIGFLIIDFPLAIGLGLFIGLPEHGSLSADHRIYSHHPAGLIESCRYRRKFLVDTGTCTCGLRSSTGHTGHDSRTENHGKDYRTESCHHSAFAFHLGIPHGNAGNDYSSSRHHIIAFLLPTIHPQKRSGSFSGSRKH